MSGNELRIAGKHPGDVMTVGELASYLKLSKVSRYQFTRADKVLNVKIDQRRRCQKASSMNG